MDASAGSRPNLTNVFLATVAVAVIGAAMHTAHAIAGLEVEHNALSFTADWSVPTFLTAGLALCAAGASALAASERRHERAAWLAFAALMIAFAADELFEVHDRVEARGYETPVLVLAVLAEPAIAVVL